MNKKTCFIVLAVLFALCAYTVETMAIQGAPAMDTKTDQAQAIAMLKEFYTRYITESDKDTVDEELMVSIEEKYLTPELLDRLNSGYMEYDPILNAQDVDIAWLKTLTITAVADQKDAYMVCYRYSNDDPANCVTLFLVKVNGHYLINDILDLDNAIMDDEDVEGLDL